MSDERLRLWHRLIEVLEGHYSGDPLPAGARTEPTRLLADLRDFDLDRRHGLLEMFDAATTALGASVGCRPRMDHVGLLGPGASPIGVAAEALVAAANPCLATYAGSPFAVELERSLVQLVGTKFGYAHDVAGGTFTSGGSEANHSALVLALVRRLPAWRALGVRSLPGRPTVYASREVHPSVLRAVRLAGLGDSAVRLAPVAADLRVDVDAVRALVEEDRRRGDIPIMLVATVGTTSSGTIDDLGRCAAIVRECDLWFHVDAAWGGAAVLLPELAHRFRGVEAADSITFDAHKWLSVPLRTGMLLTRHPQLLRDGFGFPSPFVPDDRPSSAAPDPCTTSMQWSRRFDGLKLFLTLAVGGWDDCRDLVRRQIALGERLRRGLTATGWRVLNRTELPIVCFDDGARSPETRLAELVMSAQGRVSLPLTVTRLGSGRVAVRASAAGATTEGEVDELVARLSEARTV